MRPLRERTMALVGTPFQLCIIISMLFQVGRFEYREIPTLLIVSLGATGSAIVHYTGWLIYIKSRRTKKLITNGLFRWTRHPMYTGFSLIGIVLWYPTSQVEHPSYWISLATFVTGIVVAGWLQERETIARFGKEAVEYYRETPRIAFLRWRR